MAFLLASSERLAKAYVTVRKGVKERSSVPNNINLSDRVSYNALATGVT